MKFLKSISLFCLVFIMILLGAYFLFSRNLLPLPAKAEEEILTEASEKEGSTQDLTVSTKQNVTTCDTVYEVKSYIGNSCVYSTETLPFSFLGLTREELLKEMELYEKSPSFADKQKGFLSIELLKFSPDRIIVKKVYAKEKEKIIYYLKAVNHELVVFKSDSEEPYMPTELTLDMLPLDVQQEIIATKCFNDIREVYDFLESYTS